MIRLMRCDPIAADKQNTPLISSLRRVFNREEHVSASITAGRISILALAVLVAACQTVPETAPEPPERIATHATPPDLNRCDLSHSFVLGDTFDYPAAIEIWACQRKSVVTLNQILGRWPDRIRQLRSHLTTEAGPDERVVGCRKDFAYFSGIVAVASHADPLHPTVVRAWKADLDNWTFEKTAPSAVVCNH